MPNAITVEKLSKQYQIGELHRRTTFRETVVDLLRHPFRKKNRETIYALKDVSFSVELGEVIGIIGRNGAGKSTLLKLLSKITYPTSGSINVRGKISSLLEVGTGFHEELTGRENIYLNGSILGMKKKETDAKLNDIIAFSGVEKFIDTPVKRYSSGMRLRLGFAVAAHLDAELLLIDEILAVGDAEFQKKCLQRMDDLRGGGRTVLFVSHNMEAIQNLCQRVIWIDNGQVRMEGNTTEVIKKYLSTFVEMQQQTYDLSQVESRGGNGEIRFTAIEFLDQNKQPQKIICSGDSLFARLHYHAKNEIRSPHFALELFTELGTRIASFNTWASGFEIPFLPKGEGYIDLEVDALNIFAARYYISLWSASAGSLWYDRLDQCAILDVEASDFYGSGRKMTRQHFGIAIFPCKWHFNPNVSAPVKSVEISE